MSDHGPSRRGLLAALTAGIGLSFVSRPGGAQSTGDRGIGGTGFAPSGSTDDRGIGGTGFVGTIQRFGSIVVNDRRISYPPGVRVTIDGRVASARELRLGQVVSIVAAQSGQDGLRTSAIVISHEVVGRVRSVDAGAVNILNQRVDFSQIAEPVPKPGQRIAVSGLRRLDGVIVASLVEPARPGPDRVIGVVEQDSDGYWIDGLKLDRADPAWLGRRMALTGRPTSAGFAITSATAEQLPGSGAVSRLSVQAYLWRDETALRLGNGLVIRDAWTAGQLLPGAGGRGIVELAVDRGGQLNLAGVRLQAAGSDGPGASGGFGAPGTGLGAPGAGFGAPGAGFGGPGGFGAPGGPGGFGSGPPGSGFGGGMGGIGPGGGFGGGPAGGGGIGGGTSGAGGGASGAGGGGPR